MSDIITLHLTRAEALALDAFASRSAEQFFTHPAGRKDFACDGWDDLSAAVACDSLRAAIDKERPLFTWLDFLTVKKVVNR